MQTYEEHMAALRAWEEEKSKPIWGTYIDESKIRINRHRLGAWARRQMRRECGKGRVGDHLRERLDHWRGRGRVVFRVCYVLAKGLNR